MSRLFRLILFFSLLVLTFDAIGAGLARHFGFAYEELAPAVRVLYVLAGFTAFQPGRLMDGFWTGLAMGLTNATLGWYISSLIGVGITWGQFGNNVLIYITIIWVSLISAGLGLLGAAFRWLLMRRRTTA